MKILPVTSLLVVLALARSSTAQTLPFPPAALLGTSAQITLAVTTSLVPTAPASVSLAALNVEDVRVGWADRSTNETSFEIQREFRWSGRWINTATVGTTGADVTSFFDTPGLGTFRYRVRAVNAYGSSAWTKWATVRVR